MSDNVRFTTVGPDGHEGNIRTLSYAAIDKCPHSIIWPEHYRADGTCKCNDPNDPDMPTWEYVWNAEKGMWVNAPGTIDD